MSKLEAVKLPPEAAYQQLLQTWMAYVSVFMQALTDKFGSEEALKFIRPYLFELGKQFGGSAPQMGITGKDALAIGTFIHTIEQEIMKIEGEVTEASPEKVVKVNRKCIFQDCKPEACLQFQHLADGIVEGINPEYSCRLTIPSEYTPEGDGICGWVVEKKT